jgi:hypothetical protein
MPNKGKKSKHKPRRLRQTFEAHLGVALDEAVCLSHEVKPTEYVNLQRAIDRWLAAAGPQAQVLGYGCDRYWSDEEWLQKLIADELVRAPVERTEMDSAPGKSLDCVTRGAFLLRRPGGPVALVLRPGRYSSDLPVLEAVAATRELARGTMTALRAESDSDSVYKGRSITVEGGDNGLVLRFHDLRPTAREDVILPAELIEVIERNVLGLLRHGETLRAAGRSLRHGLLFHGPPGTGKTMMLRYLAQTCKEHTVILVPDPHEGMIRDACQVARLLAPSMVVLEDADLVAGDRDRQGYNRVLHELLNEMDGMGAQAEVIFLLTTNRPDVLESALSARPGRIDQAVEFPLPDEDCRRRLFALYGRDLDLTAVDVPRWVAQTDGVSPAFIAELLRKSALMAAERGETSRPLRLTDEDVKRAVRELVTFGGELTRKLLGYGTGRFGLAAGRPD